MTTWEPIVFWSLFGVLVLAGAWGVYHALFYDRSRGRPRCPKCWYDMTGAPSLTCPECGHDARTERRLYKTRRAWRLLGVYLLAMALSVYAIEVRDRVTRSRERPLAAVIPTTLRILAIYAEPEDSNWGGGNRSSLAARTSDGPSKQVLWAWQRYLYADSLYRRIMRVPAEPKFPTDSHNPLLSPLHGLMKTSDHAIDRVLTLIREHPNAGVRKECIIYPIDLPERQLVAVRREMFSLADAGAIDFADAVLFAAGMPPKHRFSIEDTEFDRELEQVMHGLPELETLLEMYLVEAVRRRTPVGDALILALSAEEHPEPRSRLVMAMARARIQGTSDPIRLVLRGDHNELILEVIRADSVPWLDLTWEDVSPRLELQVNRPGVNETGWVHANNWAPRVNASRDSRELRYPLVLEEPIGARMRARVVLGFEGDFDEPTLLGSNVVEFVVDEPTTRPASQ